MTVHAQIPARLTRTPAAAAHEGRLAGPLQVRWLLGGLVFAFGLPFVFADLVGLQRDVYYAIYVVAAFAFFATWAWQTQQPLRAFLTRRWKWSLLLGVVTGGLLMLIVLRQPATVHPHGWAFVGAILWRGVAYGAADGLLLSAFPVLAVFSLFRGQAAAGANAESGRRHRRACARRLAALHGRLPPRLPRLPQQQGQEPDDRRCHLEHTDAPHAQPARSADRPHRPPRHRSRAQLQHRPVPASTPLTRGDESRDELRIPPPRRPSSETFPWGPPATRPSTRSHSSDCRCPCIGGGGGGSSATRSCWSATRDARPASPMPRSRWS